MGNKKPAKTPQRMATSPSELSPPVTAAANPPLVSVAAASADTAPSGKKTVLPVSRIGNVTVTGRVDQVNNDVGQRSMSAANVDGVQLNTSDCNISRNLISNNQTSCEGNIGGKFNSKNDEGKNVVAWTSLFKNNRSSANGTLLTQVFDGISHDGIHFDKDELEDDNQVSRSLIGFFSPKFPGMEAIKQLTESWKHKCDIFRHASTWTVFTFPSNEEALGVLEAGPYKFFGNALHLRAMPKFFNFSREAQTVLPVWIQLHNLPLDFWKPRLLSKICTPIGKPLHTDSLTTSRERISFARCLVQVSLKEVLPTTLTLHMPDGTILEQPVLYENKPICCDKCKRVGHADSECRDPGLPSLYVMRKPKNKGGQVKKVNAASAPVDTWVQVGKRTDFFVDPSAVEEGEDQEEDVSSKINGTTDPPTAPPTLRKVKSSNMVNETNPSEAMKIGNTYILNQENQAASDLGSPKSADQINKRIKRIKGKKPSFNYKPPSVGELNSFYESIPTRFKKSNIEGWNVHVVYAAHQARMITSDSETEAEKDDEAAHDSIGEGDNKEKEAGDASVPPEDIPLPECKKKGSPSKKDKKKDFQSEPLMSRMRTRSQGGSYGIDDFGDYADYGDYDYF